MMPPPSCNCGKSKGYLDQLQYQRLIQFIMGQNDGYNQARSQILMKSKMLSVNQAYALIKQDESQKQEASSNYSHHEGGSNTFFTSRSSGSKKMNRNSVCEFCHMKWHVKDDCYKLMKCDHYGKPRHLIVKCFQLIAIQQTSSLSGRMLR